MGQIKELLATAWQNFLDDYEENPDSHRNEEPLIVKVGRDLRKAAVYESDTAPFIDRGKNFIFSLEFDKGKTTNFDAIAERITRTL